MRPIVHHERRTSSQVLWYVAPRLAFEIGAAQRTNFASVSWRDIDASFASASCRRGRKAVGSPFTAAAVLTYSADHPQGDARQILGTQDRTQGD